MGSDWELLTLEEANVELIDCDHRTPPATDYGYPYVAIPQIKNGRIDLSDVRMISEEHYKEWTRKAKPQAYDIVLSRRCNPGVTAFVPLGLEFALGQNLVLLRADGTKVFPPFLRWLVNSPFWWDQIAKFMNVGAVFDSLKCADVPKFELPIPPPKDQKAIAAVLGALDDKIELNRKMNETLEAMAKALFKSWFVDFDPVRAKAKQRQGEPLTDADQAILASLAPDLLALFPDSFEDSDLGEIPSGWSVGTLGNISENLRRGINPTDIKPETPYIGLDHMPRKCIALSEWGRAEEVVSNKLTFNKGEILFGKLRPYFHKVGVAALDGVCSTDIIVMKSKSFEWFGYLLCISASETFVNYTNASSDGTRMPRTTWEVMSKYELTLSSLEIAQVFNNLINPTVERIISNIHEAKTLTRLRDALLPKLISGELTVRDAESLVGSI